MTAKNFTYIFLLFLGGYWLRGIYAVDAVSGGVEPHPCQPALRPLGITATSVVVGWGHTLDWRESQSRYTHWLLVIGLSTEEWRGRYERTSNPPRPSKVNEKGGGCQIKFLFCGFYGAGRGTYMRCTTVYILGTFPGLWLKVPYSSPAGWLEGYPHPQ